MITDARVSIMRISLRIPFCRCPWTGAFLIAALVLLSIFIDAPLVEANTWWTASVKGDCFGSSSPIRVTANGTVKFVQQIGPVTYKKIFTDDTGKVIGIIVQAGTYSGQSMAFSWFANRTICEKALREFHDKLFPPTPATPRTTQAQTRRKWWMIDYVNNRCVPSPRTTGLSSPGSYMRLSRESRGPGHPLPKEHVFRDSRGKVTRVAIVDLNDIYDTANVIDFFPRKTSCDHWRHHLKRQAPEDFSR